MKSGRDGDQAAIAVVARPVAALPVTHFCSAPHQQTWLTRMPWVVLTRDVTWPGKTSCRLPHAVHLWSNMVTSLDDAGLVHHNARPSAAIGVASLSFIFPRRDLCSRC